MQSKGHSDIAMSVRGRTVFQGAGVLMALVMLLALVCSVPAGAALAKISSVQITNSADAAQIVVKAGGPISVRVEKLSKFLAFDVRGHLAASQSRQVSINSGDIGVIKCGWYKSQPPTARIAVAVVSSRPYSVKYSSDKRQATITVAKRVAVAKPVVAVKGAVQTCTVAKVDKPVLIASAKPVAVNSTAVQSAPVIHGSNRVSLDFVGTDIHDVLKALALQSNSNIVASPDVKGEVTVSLNNVTVDEALKLITNLSGFKFQEVDGAYVVGTAANLTSLATGAAPAAAAPGRVGDVAMIRHSDPAVLSKMLATQFQGIDVSSTSVADDKKGIPNGTSMLVLSGTQEQVDAAKKLVAQVENSLAANAAATETEMYEVKYADVNELAAVLAGYVPGLKITIGPNQGFNLESPQALSLGNATDAQGSTGAKAVIAPPKVLILQGSASELASAKGLLAKVDVQQPQIVIEAKVIDILNDSAKDLGIEWSWSGVGFDEYTTDETGTPTAITLGNFHRSPVSILGKLNALITSEKARVLANPSIAALDGKQASIFIGRELKYVVNIQQTPTGINVTTETARVGVQLHTVSRVSTDGYITMDLHPEVSMPYGDGLEIPEIGLSLPEISRRYVDTTVRIKDGETIVIGGLISEEEREIASRIPLLSDLPLIGGLFKTKNKSKNRSEIMMFITPRILTNAQ